MKIKRRESTPKTKARQGDSDHLENQKTSRLSESRCFYLG